MQALDDLDSTAEYLARHSAKLASVFIEKAFSKPDTLKRFPRIGRKVPELDNDACRELIMGKYRIVYLIVSESRIDILTVHDSSRPLPPSFMFE